MFATGQNYAGYLPEAEPEQHANWEDARAAALGNITDHIDFMAEHNPDWNPDKAEGALSNFGTWLDLHSGKSSAVVIDGIEFWVVNLEDIK